MIYAILGGALFGLGLVMAWALCRAAGREPPQPPVPPPGDAEPPAWWLDDDPERAVAEAARILSAREQPKGV